jgi:hypothetical protein
MHHLKCWPLVFAMLAVAAPALVPALAQQPTCDPPTEPGWRVVASVEDAGSADGPPYAAGRDWVLDRTTTRLPMCSYFSPVGSYSLQTYSLDPVTRTTRVTLCRAGTPVAPYAGPCPPK